MRILFTGAAPWCNSGYSKPLRNLLPRLVRAGHEINLACFYGYQGATTMTKVDGEPIRIFGLARERFYNDIIEFHAASCMAELVITLQDVWTLEGWGEKGIRWIPWMPVDCDPVTGPVKKALEGPGLLFPMSFSLWGKEKLMQAGYDLARYMPFGVDLEVHRPRPQGVAREPFGLPADAFVVGMVAANSSYPSRKSFPEMLLAWKKWTDQGGEGILYLHTTLTPKRELGIDFMEFLSVIGLDWSTLDDPDPDRRARASVLFPCQHKMWCHAYGDQELANLYNCFDALFCVSQSEGFGIPMLEAQASGVPVVTLNFSSMPELTFSGSCIEPVQLCWHDQGGMRAVAGVDQLVKALAWAKEVLLSPGGREYYSKKARAKAEAFCWDRIVDTRWLPMLREAALEIA